MTVNKLDLKVYKWQGINQAGNTLNGKLLAANSFDVQAELQSKKIAMLRCKPSLIHFNSFLKLNLTHLASFSRELATLINAGIPLANSLKIIHRGISNILLGHIVTILNKQVESGKLFSTALQAYPQYFDPLFINLIAAGEQAGTLDKTLLHLADYQERRIALKRKISKALFYPISICILAVIVTLFMLIVIMPKFAQLFTGFGAQLPLITQLLLTVAAKIRKYGWLVLIGSLIIIFILKKILKKSSPFKYHYDKWFLKLPILGNMLKKVMSLRCFYTLAMTLEVGLSLPVALEATKNVLTHSIYQHGIDKIQQSVLAGQSIQTAFAASTLFTERDLQMLAIGEESGTLSTMLTKLVQYYEEGVNYQLEYLVSLLEPLLMIVLCIVIGGLVLAMYMPIFRLGSII